MKESEESVVATWVFILIITGLFALNSFMAYRFVGDAARPSWRYGVVRDVPAESPYAIYEKLPDPQHVRGTGGE